MRTLSVAELNRMILHSSESFSDTCTIDIKTVTRNEYGEEIPVFTSGSLIPCGFEWLSGIEAEKGELKLTESRGKFRLPITSVISIEDRITLVKRYNQTVLYTFEVVSEPIKNLDCIVLEAIFAGV